MRRTTCRLWWPAYLCSKNKFRSTTFLFGWSVSTSVSSLDIIVAFAFDEAELSSSVIQDLNHLPVFDAFPIFIVFYLFVIDWCDLMWLNCVFSFVFCFSHDRLEISDVNPETHFKFFHFRKLFFKRLPIFLTKCVPTTSTVLLELALPQF